MAFNSWEFLIFLMTVLLVSAVLRNYHQRAEIWFLVAASAYFYGQWNWGYLLLIYTTIFVDYLIGIQCFKSNKPERFISFSLMVNLGILGVFKYGNLLLTTTNEAMSLVGSNYQLNLLNVLLPVGISFYTFQSLSYTIDCYRGTTKPQKNLVDYALFVSFFPQLVAGPIIRANSFFRQLNHHRQFTFYMAQSGVFLIVLGLVKKIVLADNLAALTNPVFTQPESYNFTFSILAIYGFAFQLYYDFSGYTDIAIGIARLLGFNFPRNFNYPYIALSVREFWQRWHITLSRWLRDYVYRSLGGSKKGEKAAMRNIFITLLIGGFWHGASWNMAIWGAINGIAVVIETLNSKYQWIRWDLNNPLIRFFKWLLVIHFLSLAVVFFRAPDFQTAQQIFINLSTWQNGFSLPSDSYLFGFFILSLPFLHWFSSRLGINYRCGEMGSFEYVSWLTIFGVLLFIFGGEYNQDFFYFQF